MGRRIRLWAAPLALAAIAVGVVLAAPLATPNKASAGPIISGARSLSDQVSVKLAEVPSGHTTTDVHVLAFNDLHGTILPGTNNIYGHFAGGVSYLAKVVKAKQAQYGDNQTTVFAGDNIGAAPLENGLFHEEPIVIASNLMHVDFASVGNHEFDKGATELLRIQNGGCHPDGCTGKPYALASGGSTDTYPGADFQYLSANVIRNSTGQPLFPAYGVKQFASSDGKHKFRVGFIGEVLQSTPSIVTPSGVAGLTFQDEAEAANKAVAELADKGVKVPILVVHQGGFQTGFPNAPNGCAGSLAGSDIAAIADKLDPAIKVIVSAHTHAEYRCTYTSNGVTRLITSASSFGRILSDITLTIDNKNDKLVSVSADNVIIDNAKNLRTSSATVRDPDPSKEDPAVQAVVNQYAAAAAPLANTVIGHIQGDLTRTGAGVSALGESTLGDVIADAQLAATAPAPFGAAVVAFMNPGGIRQDLFAATHPGGAVTYGEAFNVQPFGNSLVTKTMTGDMIHRVLEQQFLGCQGPGATPAPTTGRILQVSVGFKYEQKFDAPTCAEKVGHMSIGGVEVTPAATYRVTMNNFLAFGGDGFTVFNEGTAPLGGAQDIDALVAYFASKEPAGIPVPVLGDRIVPKP
jgi:5'-nucleotidase